MKITIIHHFGGLGGGTISCFDIAKILTELGHSVTVAIKCPSKETKEFMYANNINFRTDVPPIMELNFHSASRSAFKAMVKFALSLKYKRLWVDFFEQIDSEVIILNSIIQAPLIGIIKQINKKCICFVRETICGDQKSILNRKIKKRLERADAVSFLTDFDLKAWDLKKVYTIVIPDIVDPQKYSNEKSNNRKSESTIFMYLGGLSYVKGALDLLEAFKALCARNNKCKLLLLGDLYQQFSKPSIKNRVLHYKECKFVQKCLSIIESVNTIYSRNAIEVIGLTKDTSKWYANANVVVFPVKNVHQARPVYEAGYYDLPVIVPDYDNFKEIVIDRYNGIRYEPNNVQSLCNAMEKLYSNNNLLIKYGNNNKKKTFEEHSIMIARDKMTELLKDI